MTMRYLPLTPEDRAEMLGVIGVNSVDDLFVDVPLAARRDGLVDLPTAQGELEVDRELSRLATQNRAAISWPFFCGAGAYRHHVPASVDHLIQRSEFLTSYTPYQPEIAQGTLQVLFEFQTQVAALTGMEVANASMYDGSTAASEGVMMAARVTRRNKAVLSPGLHPHYAETIQTLAHAVGMEIERMPLSVDAEADVLSHIGPDVGLLKSPGEMGADIVAAEGQSIGNGLNFGGPYVGLFATRDKYVRQAPGRLCGETVDADGRRGFALTLSTREQHIRRDKATSNICTNSGLCALAFTIHMSLLGEMGLRRLAALNHQMAKTLAATVAEMPGFEVLTPRFFNEIAVRTPIPAADYVQVMADNNIMAGVPVSRLDPAAGMDDVLLMAVTETTRAVDIQLLQRLTRRVLNG
jgi:glycine dehydrogenase subunit 1